MWVELILGFVGCLWILDLVITKIKGDEPTVKRSSTEENPEDTDSLKDETKHDASPQHDGDSIKPEDATQAPNLPEEKKMSSSEEIIEEVQVMPTHMGLENSAMGYTGLPNMSSEYDHFDEMEQSAMDDADAKDIQSLDCDMLNQCLDDVATTNITEPTLQKTTEELVAACMECDVEQTVPQGAPIDQPCFEETHIQEEIVPVHIDHHSEDEKDTDKPCYEERYVQEEIVPVHIDHPIEDENDADHSTEMPCYEESAVEEQIVPVYMDHPSEDSNEGEITNETIHEEIVMAEESAPVSSEKRMENTAMEQGDESAASNVTTGYGKVEINLTPPSSPQGAERTPQKSAEDHTSGVPVPKKKINRKRYTGAKREYLPMKDGLPIGLRPTSLEKEVQSATASENNKEPKEKSLPAQSKELGQDDKEEKKKPLKKNKDGSSRIPLPASIPITGAAQSVTDEAGPEGASKSKSKRRRKKKGPGKSATNELSNRWPPT